MAIYRALQVSLALCFAIEASCCFQVQPASPFKRWEHHFCCLAIVRYATLAQIIRSYWPLI